MNQIPRAAPSQNCHKVLPCGVRFIETDLDWRVHMKSLLDMPIFIVGLLGIAIAVWQSMAFLGARDPAGIPDMMAGVNHLWWAIGAAIIATLCAVLYFVRHPRIEEEIHISK